MRSRATHAVDGAKVRSHIAALATACLLNLTGAVQADLAPAQQSLVDGYSWGMSLGLAYAGTHSDAVRAVVTIGSGPITLEYLSVFSDNQIARLGACELEVRDFWKDPAREAADSDRAAFERLRAATPAYFYDRKKALQM